MSRKKGALDLDLSIRHDAKRVKVMLDLITPASI